MWYFGGHFFSDLFGGDATACEIASEPRFAPVGDVCST